MNEKPREKASKIGNHSIRSCFKALDIAIPDSFAKVELSVKEFVRLARKLDFSPVFENKEGYAYIDPEGPIFYYAKKGDE